MLIRRAVLMLGGALMFVILFGWVNVAAVAADTGAHAGSAARVANAGQPADNDQHCHDGWWDDHGDHCCRTAPTPAPTATPRPETTPEPTAQPRRTPSATPRPHHASAATPPQGRGAAPPGSPSPTPGSSPGSPAGTRPPVLAPPALTVPPLGPVDAAAAEPSALGVIAVSTILVASMTAAVSLVLIRRSS